MTGAFDWVELAWFTGVIILALIATGNTPEKEPHRVKVCLVGSGAEREDVSSTIWSDQIKHYKKIYPGSYCGSCGDKVKCPEQ
jgi:hypothetical protein